MNIKNIKTQMKKSILEFCILSIIKDGEVYASDIIDTLKHVKFFVVEGTIYPLLTRLKNTSLLHYRWKESSFGPPKKYFPLTTKGEAVLKELNETWNELSESVDQLRKKTHTS
ncbi:MAG: PadR family transcriptional regulator [Flavobacteriales bacterium AspAUS03]